MITRVALATGFALTLGLAFIPLGCENWDRPTFTHVHALPESPDPWDLPAQGVEQLEACARSLPAASPSTELPSHLIAFGMQVEESGQVGAARLKHSTLADRGVEACMAGALRGMPLPMRELMAATQEGRKHPPSPELGGLFDDDSQVSLQMLPVALTVAGGVIIVVVVLWASHKVIEAILAPARATAAAPPRAAAPPKARRHPNQTCEDAELKALEKEKSRLCESGFAADCSGKRERQDVRDRHDKIPCSKILKSIDERHA